MINPLVRVTQLHRYQAGATTLGKHRAVKIFGAKRKPTPEEYRKLASEAALNLSLHPKTL